jgi:hypothetical protein
MSSTAYVQFAGGPAGGETMTVPATRVGQPICIPVLDKFTGMWEERNPPELVPLGRVTYVLLRKDFATGTYIYVPEENASAPRPEPGSAYRWCHECDVKWWGGETCWCCDQSITDAARPSF